MRQPTLARAEALARVAHGRRVFGLLLGQFYQCPETGADYLVIESVAEQPALIDESELAEGIKQALARTSDGKHAHVIGWYRSVSHVEAKPSVSTVAIHTAYFAQPWQTTLVIADGANVPGGAFFLHDTANSRWFYAPFYELSDQTPAAHQPKVTCVSWPQYLTTDTVVLTAREPTPAPQRADFPAAQPPYEDPTSARPPLGDHGTDVAPTVEPADSRWSTSPAGAGARDPVAPGGLPDNLTDDAPGLTDHPPHASPEVYSVEIPEKRRKGSAARGSDRPVKKPPTVNDSDQRRAGGRGTRRVGDAEDTAVGDEPARYIELARAEGFFVAAAFDSVDRRGRETLWVLNEPYSGLLLTVVGADGEVVDASLHYNLHTDDAGVRRTPFPEHRDPESRTIYMRETCVDSLRARCRRLRATNALEREWKVSPTMLLLMPNEWQSVAMSKGGAGAISALNDARIAELPEGVRSQFRLTTQGDATA